MVSQCVVNAMGCPLTVVHLDNSITIGWYDQNHYKHNQDVREMVTNMVGWSRVTRRMVLDWGVDEAVIRCVAFVVLILQRRDCAAQRAHPLEQQRRKTSRHRHLSPFDGQREVPAHAHRGYGGGREGKIGRAHV